MDKIHISDEVHIAKEARDNLALDLFNQTKYNKTKRWNIHVWNSCNNRY